MRASTAAVLAMALRRDPAKVAQDVARGYYTAEQAQELFGVRFRADGSAYRPAQASVGSGLSRTGE